MNDENSIRVVAHQIWEAEGCPDGQHERHWDMACKLLLGGGPRKPRTSRTTKQVSRPTAVESPTVVKSSPDRRPRA